MHDIEIMIEEEVDFGCEVCEIGTADVIVTLDSPLRTPIRSCAKCALEGVAQGACTW